jgi:large subunit ribosomal protein LP2
MRHLAAYMLLVTGGNASPSAQDVKDLLSKAGISADDERLTTLLAELNGKSLPELIEAGKDLLHVGGGVAAAPAGGAAPAAAGAAPAAKAAEKPKEEEVDALDGGMDMFGGGGGGGKGDY